MLNLPQVFHSKRFSLVFSGGGALGYAHLAVIKNLEDNNIFPSETIGSSMGAVFAAAMAIGLKSDYIEEIIIKCSSYHKWFRFSFNRVLLSHKNIYKIFDEIFGDLKIKDSLIPLKIIAYNLKENKCHLFEKDVYIKDALLASTAVPGVFKSVKINNEIFADGCLCENLPVSFAEHSLIMGVNVFNEKTLKSYSEKNTGIISKIELFAKLMIYNNTKCILKNLDNKKIYLVEPDVSEFSIFDFNKFYEIKQCKLYGRWISK